MMRRGRVVVVVMMVVTGRLKKGEREVVMRRWTVVV